MMNESWFSLPDQSWFVSKSFLTKKNKNKLIRMIGNGNKLQIWTYIDLDPNLKHCCLNFVFVLYFLSYRTSQYLRFRLGRIVKQCCGSRLARILNFLTDPDPKWPGKKDPNTTKIGCFGSTTRVCWLPEPLKMKLHISLWNLDIILHYESVCCVWYPVTQVVGNYLLSLLF